MDQQYFKEYFQLERQHWWFTARAQILKTMLSQELNGKNDLKLLNIGVATGATSEMLQHFGEVTSVEFDKDCCIFLEDNLNLNPINASMTDLPFDDRTFDCVCAFDVVEHIKDDEKALAELDRVLKTEGVFFVTVPAFDFLWSQHDEINHHERRYMIDDLCRKLRNLSLNIHFSSYYNFFLFPFSVLFLITSKFFSSKKQSNEARSNFKLSKGLSFMNRLFYGVFKAELFQLKRHRPFPFGLSIMVIGSKNTE